MSSAESDQQPGFAPSESAPGTEIPVLSVTEFTACLAAVVDVHFPRMWVAGEISNLTRAASGHLYFTLKDEQSQLKSIIWRTTAQRLKFDLREGLEVVVAGRIEVYGPRGQYQIIIDRLLPQGIGAQELAFRQLYQKLQAEGLFNEARKRPLPKFPRGIALVSSPTGAAVRDMIQVISRRWPAARIVVVPVAVQGADAARQIAAGLRSLQAMRGLDVAICGRGGGASEDLVAFNDERVARAILASPIPVISAVGHEIDVTIADLVADRRALTPSEAAEMAVPSCEELIAALSTTRRRLLSALQNRAARAKSELESLARRGVLKRPYDRIRQSQQRLDQLEERLHRSGGLFIRSAGEKLDQIASSLDALSPLNVLRRGYSLTKRLSSDELIRSVRQAQRDDRISILLSDGMLIGRVEEIRTDFDE